MHKAGDNMNLFVELVAIICNDGLLYTFICWYKKVQKNINTITSSPKHVPERNDLMHQNILLVPGSFNLRFQWMKQTYYSMTQLVYWIFNISKGNLGITMYVLCTFYRIIDFHHTLFCYCHMAHGFFSSITNYFV